MQKQYNIVTYLLEFNTQIKGCQQDTGVLALGWSASGWLVFFSYLRAAITHLTWIAHILIPANLLFAALAPEHWLIRSKSIELTAEFHILDLLRWLTVKSIITWRYTVKCPFSKKNGFFFYFSPSAIQAQTLPLKGGVWPWSWLFSWNLGHGLRFANIIDVFPFFAF